MNEKCQIKKYNKSKINSNIIELCLDYHQHLLVNRYLFLLVLLLSQIHEVQTNVFLFLRPTTLLLHPHAHLEVIPFILLLNHRHPFTCLLPLEFDLTDVGLIAVEPMHGESKHKQQYSQGNPYFGVLLLWYGIIQLWFLKFKFHICLTMLTVALQPLLNLLYCLSRDQYVGKEGALAPSAMFLAPKYCIFLMKVLNLFFHCFYTDPLSIAIVFGIVFISFFQMVVIFIVEIAINVKLLVELLLEEMLLGHFREGLKMFISETRGVIKPTPLNYFFKAKLVTHYKTLNISKYQQIIKTPWLNQKSQEPICSTFLTKGKHFFFK